jgi:hypothetical protein
MTTALISLGIFVHPRSLGDHLDGIESAKPAV